ncbi:MAG: LysR substrate-binding domain-containing protein, partial [Hydrogenovibrio sp.]|nr:LysR substrate-binding domain-containing protein [Hydrogenovibrio sp.]
LQSLKHHQLLKYGNDELNSWRLEDEQGQKHDISFASRIHANNGEFLREMAKAGHGIILSPTFIVWQDIADGSLVPVLSQYRKPTIYAYAVYPRNRYLSKKTRVFIDFLVAHFDNRAYWDERP